jgi:thioredoxin-related protein
MKLLFITKEDCIYCMEKREMVYHELPALIPGLKIEEYDIFRDEDRFKEYYDTTQTPGFVMLTDNGKMMFRIIGVPGASFIMSLIESYEAVKNGLLTDEELELVSGGALLTTNIVCKKEYTCVKENS